MESLGSLLAELLRLFSETTVPLFPELTFLELYLSVLAWGGAVWVFWAFLGHIRASSYAAGRPKRNKKDDKEDA